MKSDHSIKRITNYARIAQAYDEHAFLPSQISEELLSRLDLIQIDIKHVVELGCGTGRHLKALHKRFPKAKLSFVDSSIDMLKQAKQHNGWFKKYKFLCEDAQAISLADNSIDCVISNLMLQDCTQPDAVFTEVQRVCRENGLFTFSTLGPDSFTQIREAATLSKIELEEHAFGHLTDMHDIGDALLRAGMREPVLDVEIFTLQFSKFAQLFNELDLTGHICQQFTQAELNSLSENYPRLSRDTDFEVTFEVVYGQAWAGDGKSKSRTPEEFQFPLDKLIQRKK